MKQFLLTILIVCCGCQVSDAPLGSATLTARGHTTDSLSDVKSRVEAGQAVLIDVREQGEWEAGHLQVAKLIPMSVVKAGPLDDQLNAHLPKDKPIYLHCKSGGRVLTVSELLSSQGYDIRPLEAGYSELVEAGFEPAP